MATQTKVTVDLSGLQELIRELGSEYVTKVGILGSDAGKTYEDGEGMTVSEVGLYNEFGTDRIPARSFLRMPIEQRQRYILEKLSTPSIRAMIEKGDIKGVYARLGFEAQNVIQGAFSTSGFGQWPPNAPSTVAAKGSSKPLIDTAQLRKSITSKVVKRDKING